MPMSRNFKSGHKRQPQNFYATPPWVTEELLETLRRWGIRLPKGKIWEPCCGDGAISRELESRGYSVVSTDLVYRGYGEGGRDFMKEDRLPDGVTAIVTNPPYGPELPKFVDHALELLRPVGGMLVLLVNNQWKTAATNSARCRIPAYEASVTLSKRIRWFPGTKEQPKENHCWLIWDHSRRPGPAKDLFAAPNVESEPEIRSCIVCRNPLPLTARADKQHCSPRCRQHSSRQGMAQSRTGPKPTPLRQGFPGPDPAPALAVDLPAWERSGLAS
jgi:hypothetical protein